MDVFDAIAERHSYRGPFRDQKVPRSDLKRIVQAGLQAPSGKNEQTTTFLIVDDVEVVRRISEMPGANMPIRQAQAFIACIADVQPKPVFEGHDFQIEDCAAAVENMLLAITALGYATVWIDGWLRVKNRADTIGPFLALPEGKTIRVLLPIGVPEETWPQKEKKPFDKRAWFNQYEGAES